MITLSSNSLLFVTTTNINNNNNNNNSVVDDDNVRIMMSMPITMMQVPRVHGDTCHIICKCSVFHRQINVNHQTNAWVVLFVFQMMGQVIDRIMNILF
jgi:hypothetical protein